MMQSAGQEKNTIDAFHEPSEKTAFWFEMFVAYAGFFVLLSWFGTAVADRVFNVHWCTVKDVIVCGISIAVAFNVHAFIEWKIIRARKRRLRASRCFRSPA